MADGALVVDLREMRAVDGRSGAATAHGRAAGHCGRTWTRATTGAWAGRRRAGPSSTPAIGGLTLSGGIGFLMGTAGLTCDNLMRAVRS